MAHIVKEGMKFKIPQIYKKAVLWHSFPKMPSGLPFFTGYRQVVNFRGGEVQGRFILHAIDQNMRS